MNTVDYVKKHQEKSFQDLPFNEVDGLLLADIVYLPSSVFVSESLDPKDGVSLASFYQSLSTYVKHREFNEFLITSYRMRLLETMAQAPRYQDIRLFGFVDQHIDSVEMQFTATSFLLPTKQIVIAFRGTDDTLIGWKENFNVACAEVTKSQRAAVSYIKEVHQAQAQANLIIVGHSKGGNLAVYGAGFQESKVQEQITKVYAYDSPGHLEASFQAGCFQEIKERIHYIVPNDSIIGRIMNYLTPPIIVQSKSFGLMQHIPRYWQIEDAHFLTVDEFTLTSNAIAQVIERWMAERTPEETAHFFNLLFDLLTANQTQSLLEIFDRPFYYFSLLREKSQEFPPADREFFDQSWGDFFNLILEVFNDLKDQRLNRWQEEWRSFLNN